MKKSRVKYLSVVIAFILCLGIGLAAAVFFNQHLKKATKTLLFKPVSFLNKYNNNSYPVVQKESREKDYNIIVILTDDQNYQTWQHMPFLSKLASKRGIIYENAFATNPTCTPFRASFLSGGFHSHETGVKSNDRKNGTLFKFDESNTLPVYLQSKGISTSFIGKYLHAYQPGYVPPGWSSFVANEEGGMLRDFHNLSRITYGQSTSKADLGKVKNILFPQKTYITNFQTDTAIKFLQENNKQQFFMYLSYYAPHVPFQAESEADVKTASKIQFNCNPEVDINTKPDWVATVDSVTSTPSEILQHGACGEKDFQGQVSLLQSMDRNIEKLFHEIEKQNLNENTIIFFVSDNGFTVGSRELFSDKGMPYESSIRVPLIIFHPDQKARTNKKLVAANLDVPATIMDLIGIKTETEGLNLLNDSSLNRERLLIENFGYLSYKTERYNIPLPPMIWSGYRTDKWKYVEYITGEKELYDINSDPYETSNLSELQIYQPVIEHLDSLLAKEKGLAITSKAIPTGFSGKDYYFKLSAWGGMKPYKWKIDQSLPKGLEFNSETGVIQGTPADAGEYQLRISIEDSGEGRHSKLPDHFTWNYSLKIKEAKS